MATNNRIFYAVQSVAVCKTGFPPSGGASANVAFLKGVQSVGITTNFTLEQAFELGQVEIYENSEDIADVEVTIEKLIDGEKLIYLSAVGNEGKTNVVSASAKQCDVYLAIYADTNTSTSGQTPEKVVNCSGMYVSSISYTYPVDGNATESVTLVGNDKFWSDNIAGVIADPKTAYGSPATGTDGSDVPVSGIIRRNNVDVAGSTLPAEVTTQGPADSRHLQNISISADFGRENILELGRFGPYYKYATFPFEVTSEFEVIATSGDLVSVSGNAENLTDRTILIKDQAGTVIDLGTKNKLTSVSYSGGDTGGGNATVSFSYSTFNDIKVNGGGVYY